VFTKKFSCYIFLRQISRLQGIQKSSAWENKSKIILNENFSLWLIFHSVASSYKRVFKETYSLVFNLKWLLKLIPLPPLLSFWQPPNLFKLLVKKCTTKWACHQFCLSPHWLKELHQLDHLKKPQLFTRTSADVIYNV